MEESAVSTGQTDCSLVDLETVLWQLGTSDKE